MFSWQQPGFFFPFKGTLFFMSYFVFTVPSSHEKVMKNLTAYRGPDTCGGKKMCSIF